MLHSPTVSRLGGPDVVRVGDVAAVEEVSESARHVGAEGQGVFGRSFSGLLDLQSVLICAFGTKAITVIIYTMETNGRYSF